jgi:hypothetical protein
VKAVEAEAEADDVPLTSTCECCRSVSLSEEVRFMHSLMPAIDLVRKAASTALSCCLSRLWRSLLLLGYFAAQSSNSTCPTPPYTMYIVVNVIVETDSSICTY